MIRILLDTNAYSDFKRGAQNLKHIVAEAQEILVPIPVLAELRVGFLGGSQETRNLAELEQFLATPRVHVPPMGEQTALFYARIYSDLKRAGTPIPINDVWIAASSMEAGAVLITSDAHFQHIAGLLVKSRA